MTTSRSDVRALLGRLNHVGIAVPDLEVALRRYRALFGPAAVGEPFDLALQGVRVAFVQTGNSEIELIAPLGDDSPIVGFLARNPDGGQHHVCHEVADMAAARAAFEAMGVRCLGEPRAGAHGTPILFLHPKDTGGVLIELMERPAHGQ